MKLYQYTGKKGDIFKGKKQSYSVASWKGF